MSLFFGSAWMVIGILYGLIANNAAAMIGCFVLGYLYLNPVKRP